MNESKLRDPYLSKVLKVCMIRFKDQNLTCFQRVGGTNRNISRC